MRFCLLFGLACAAFQLASTLPVPNPIYDHDDLDIRSTDFEVFEVRAKDNPLCVKVSGGSKKVYGHVGDIIVATVKEECPSKAVKKPDGQAVLIRNISKTHR